MYTIKAIPLLMVMAFTRMTFAQQNEKMSILSAPAENEFTVIRKNGVTVIPNGRFITPAGQSIEVAPHPYGLVLSPDGDVAVTANSGISPLSISIIKGLNGSQTSVMQVPPGPLTNRGILASVFMGLAISPDSKIVYVAGGQENKVYLFSILNGKKTDSINCAVSEDGNKYPFGYIGDMVLGRDGRYLFAVDQTNFRLVIIDALKKIVIGNVPTGRYPFGIALSHDEKKVFVANVGMFEYKKIDSIEEKRDLKKALIYPPFDYG